MTTTTPPIAQDALEGQHRVATARDASRLPSPALAWAITAGQALLWAVAAWFFLDYWIMLPVRYRWTGGLILGSSAAIAILRLILFYRRRRRSKQNPRDL